MQTGSNPHTPRLLPSDLFPSHRDQTPSRGGLLELPLSHPFLPDEDSLFEYFRDFGERNAGYPVTVLLRENRESDPDILRRSIRAVFRAAVYGDLSLLLGSVLTDEDVPLSLKTVHESFCELESEGREFNGYIPKGILIDTPIALGTITVAEGVDSICFDLSRLLRLLTGLSPKELAACPPIRKTAMEKILPLYEQLQRPTVRIATLLSDTLIHPSILSPLLASHTETIFLPEQYRKEAEAILEGLVEDCSIL